MARRSQTDNVRKLCACVKWKTCAHPWYVDYREGKELDANGNVRRRGLRRRLSVITGREPRDFADAVAEARRAIVAWKDGRDARDLQPSDDPTVSQLLEAYDKEKPRQDRWQIGRINAIKLPGITARDSGFGQLRASTITPDTLKVFKRVRPLVAGNRDLALLRAMFNWAVLGGLLPRSPFRVGDVPAVRLAREEARSRRLQGDEPERLQAGAGGLADLITAALETGCRKGELLSLQWHQVRFSPRAEIFLPAGKTKAKKDRRVPISSVLLPVLQRRQLDPAGEPLSAEAYVFGDEIGRQRHSIKTAWALTLKRAKISGLHFHDLRRECGSRWMDAGIPLATIQRWLGHANIAQTSTYLGASLGADELDMRAYEERIGRVKPLTNVDQSSGTSSDQPTSNDLTMHETTQQNVTVH